VDERAASAAALFEEAIAWLGGRLRRVWVLGGTRPRQYDPVPAAEGHRWPRSSLRGLQRLPDAPRASP